MACDHAGPPRRPGERLNDVDGSVRVQARSRLVGQQNARIVGERTRERHALTLAAGEEVGPAAPSHAESFQLFLRAPFDGLAMQCGLEKRRNAAVRTRIEFAEQMMVLEHEADMPAAERGSLTRFKAHDVVVTPHHLPRHARRQTCEREQQRGLAGPRRTAQANGLSRGYVEAVDREDDTTILTGNDETADAKREGGQVQAPSRRSRP